LKGVRVVGFEGRFIILGCPNGFSLERADRPKSRELVERTFAEVLKFSGLKIKCRLIEESEGGADSEPTNGSLEFSTSSNDESASGNGTGAGGAESEEIVTGDGNSGGQESILKLIADEFG